MARALARGWGEPVLATDAGSGRAARLAAEVGGEAVATNAVLAERADVVVLCHKPAQLREVAAEVSGRARVVASVLAGVSLADLREAYGETPVFRLMPNTPVEVGGGVTVIARDHDAAAVRREVASPGGYTEQGLQALERAGVPEALHEAMDVVTAPRRP